MSREIARSHTQIESSGYAPWFRALLQRHTLLVGDAAKIRTRVARKTRTHWRGAAHLLQLLRQDRVPVL